MTAGRRHQDARQSDTLPQHDKTGGLRRIRKLVHNKMLNKVRKFLEDLSTPNPLPDNTIRIKVRKMINMLIHFAIRTSADRF